MPKQTRSWLKFGQDISSLPRDSIGGSRARPRWMRTEADLCGQTSPTKHYELVSLGRGKGQPS